MAILSGVIAGEITGPHGPGRSDISAGWRTWLQAWDEFSIEAKEMVQGVVHRALLPARSTPNGSTS